MQKLYEWFVDFADEYPVITGLSIGPFVLIAAIILMPPIFKILGLLGHYIIVPWFRLWLS